MLPLLPLLLACRPAPLSLQARAAPQAPLGIEVSWAPADTDALWLERTLPGGAVRRDPLDPAGGAALALGHPPLSAVTLRLTDDDGAASEPVSVILGNLPPSVPTFTVTGAPIPAGRLLLLCTSVLSGSDTQDITLALDPDGQVVWYHALDAPRSYRPDLRVTEDGWWSNQIATASADVPNVLQRRRWDGTLLETLDAPGAHHVFADSPDGMAWPRDDPRELGGAVWTGDALIVGGEERFSTWEDLDAEALIANTPEAAGRRYSHANGLALRDGRFLMTMASQAAVLEIDAQTGAPLRWLGAPPPEGIDLEAWSWDEDEALVLPHMAAWTDDGTLLLTGSSPDFAETWATEFALEDQTLVPVWTHGRGEHLGTPALGHAARLSDGDSLVNFGTRGVIHRVSADGAVAGTLSVELGRIFGRAIEIDPMPLLMDAPEP